MPNDIARLVGVWNSSQGQEISMRVLTSSRCPQILGGGVLASIDVLFVQRTASSQQFISEVLPARSFQATSSSKS